MKDLKELDQRIATAMDSWGTTVLRASLGVIFVWFGILKPFGVSPEEPLVLATVKWLPLLDPHTWLAVIGWWEVVIGVSFVFRRTVRLAIFLLVLQMGGTLMPLFLLPAVTFQTGLIPFGPSMEGQYIIKNLLIISAALVVGGTLRCTERSA